MIDLASWRPTGTALRRSKVSALNVWLLLVVAGVAHPAVAQEAQHTERRTEVSGDVSITNNGVSLIPTFSLGKPAAIFNVAIRNGQLSFEPEFKMGLDGQPWAGIFWWRHRPLSGEKLQLTVGAHPAVIFRTIGVSTSAGRRDVIEARRYLAGEVSPRYALAKHLSVGAYYLYSYGVEHDAVKNTQFVVVRTTVTNVEIADGFSLQLAPQLYYLRTDDRDGWYVNAGVTLGRRNFPLSLSAMVNQPMQSTIAGGQEFVWSVSAIYSIR